jgi:hypothetical protein
VTKLTVQGNNSSEALMLGLHETLDSKSEQILPVDSGTGQVRVKKIE